MDFFRNGFEDYSTSFPFFFFLFDKQICIYKNKNVDKYL